MSRPALRLGSVDTAPRGPVRELQRLLDARGRDIKIDGIFGPKTRAALVAEQVERGLPPDGICGPATWSAVSCWQVAGDVGAEALRVDGRRVDLDLWRGSVEELRALGR